jgi:hypothetical protein
MSDTAEDLFETGLQDGANGGIDIHFDAIDSSSASETSGGGSEIVNRGRAGGGEGVKVKLGWVRVRGRLEAVMKADEWVGED